MGLGVAILANTRPYESLFFGVPVGVAALRLDAGREGPATADDRFHEPCCPWAFSWRLR